MWTKKDWLSFFDFFIMGFSAGVGNVMISTQASQYDEVDEFNNQVFGQAIIPPEDK